MAKRDYYEILGVDRSASDGDLKQAYRRLAMKYHPDRNPDDPTAEEKFKETKEAFDVLSDGSKRNAYDNFGHAGVDSSGAGSGFSGQAGFGDIFDSVFGDIFGSGRGGGRAHRGSDLSYDLDLTLEEAVFGTDVKIRVPKLVECVGCGATGSRTKQAPITCEQCGGAGQVRMQQGFFSVQQTCPACRGAGKTIKDPCYECSGTGKSRGAKTISVKIPAGVDTGDRVRLTGEGEAGLNGPHGDLFVNIGLKRHQIFQRDGVNLLCEVPIDFPTAVLGGQLEVPTIDGKVTLKIPSETQTGKMFRLRGKGVKSVRGGAVGDLICTVEIETPVKLTPDQKELLKRFADSLSNGGDKHSPKTSSWIDGVKKFFDDVRFS